MKKEKINIDTAWFQARLRDVYGPGAQRLLAKELGINPSQVTRLLKGERKMEVTEGFVIADFIKQPFEEIAKRAGVNWGLIKRTK